MEFNNTNNLQPVVQTTVQAIEKVTLSSQERVTVSSINDGVKVSTSVLDYNTVLVSHDLTDLLSKFNKDSIKTSLVTIYGKTSKVGISTKPIEALAVPLSQYPARLEYSFIITENNIPIEYKAEYLLPSSDSTTIIPITGKKQSTSSEVTIPEAVVKLDEDLANIKNILQNFSFIYDISQKKVVPLHNLITNLSVKIDILTKNLEDVKEKVKDL